MAMHETVHTHKTTITITTNSTCTCYSSSENTSVQSFLTREMGRKLVEYLEHQK